MGAMDALYTVFCVLCCNLSWVKTMAVSSTAYWYVERHVVDLLKCSVMMVLFVSFCLHIVESLSSPFLN